MEQKAKILFLTSSFPYHEEDPTSCFLKRLAFALDEMGYKILVLTPHTNLSVKKHELINEIEVIRFRYTPRFVNTKLCHSGGAAENLGNGIIIKLEIIAFFLSMFLYGWIVGKDCQIIHCQWLELTPIAWILGKLLKLPLCSSVHRLVIRNKIEKIWYRIALESADHYFFNSTYTLNKSKEIKFPRHFSISYPLIDQKLFDIPEREQGKKNLLLNSLEPNSKIILLSLGRFVPKKGHEILLNVFARILEKNKNVELIIGGYGPLEDKIKNNIEINNLSSNVKLVGPVFPHSIVDFFKSGDIFVHSAITDDKGEEETFGLVIIEAMAAGLPVISFKTGGICELVRHNETGYLIEEGDIILYAYYLECLINDFNLRKQMGERGRIVAKAFVMEEKTLLPIVDVYSMLSKKRK